MWTCDLLVRNGSPLIKYNQLEERVDMAVSGGRILETGKEPQKKHQAVEVINGKGKLFMSGLIDSHIRTGQQLLKGLVLDAKPTIWIRIMLPSGSTLTPDRIRLCVQAAALEMIRCGTAGFIDTGSYHMETAAPVYEENGLRGALFYSTMDEEGLPESIAMDVEETLERTDSLYDRFHGKGNLKAYYSLRVLNPCSSRPVEPEATRARGRDTVLQAHMNRYTGETDGIMDRGGMWPYEYLEEVYMLGSDFLGAHNLILPEQKKSLMIRRGVRTYHCPFSNCNRTVPSAPQLLEIGIPMGLGSDGAAHGGLGPWNEMKIFRSVMDVYRGVLNGSPKVMPVETILKIVLGGGAAALNEEGSLDRLEAGYKADIISINTGQPHLCPTGNETHTPFECANVGDVEDMIVGGRILMKSRRVLSLDGERIMYESRKYVEENADTFQMILQRYNKEKNWFMVFWVIVMVVNLVAGAFVGFTGVVGFPLPIIYTSPLGMEVMEGLALSFTAFIVSRVLRSVNYSKAENLDIPLGIYLSLGSLAGAALGAKSNLIIPESTVEVILYVVVLLSSISIPLHKDKSQEESDRAYAISDHLAAILILGFVIRAVRSLLGARGPVLVIPLLVVLGIDIRTTAGVALFNPVFIGIPTCIGYMTQCFVKDLLPVMVAALVFYDIGVVYGSGNAVKINRTLLKKGITVLSILTVIWKLALQRGRKTEKRTDLP